MKYICVMQDGMKDCGICSLLTIIQTHGGNVPKEYLREITNTTTKGVNAYSLVEGGKKLGFDTKAVKGNFLDIEDCFLPCIAHTIIDGKYQHFLVIHKINRKKNYVILADPAKGIVKMTSEQFSKIATGSYLYFVPNKKLPYMHLANIVPITLGTLLSKNKSLLMMIAFLSLLCTSLNMITSYHIQFVMEQAISYDSRGNLYFILLVMILFTLLKAISQYFRSSLLTFLNHQLDFSLISKSFRHILSLPHLYFKNRTTGEVLSRIQDLGELKEILSQLVVTFFTDFILVIFVLIFLFSIHATLTWMVLGMMMLFALVTLCYNRVLSRKIKMVKEEGSKVNSYMVESINSMDTIKGMNILEVIDNRFRYFFDSFLSTSYDTTVKMNQKNFLGNTITLLNTVFVIFLGGLFVMEGKLSLGNLITYHGLIYYFLEPVQNIVELDILFQRAKIITNRINELLNIEEEKLFLDHKMIELPTGDIRIHDLSYSYDGRKNLIDHLYLDIPKGSKVVICGKSGSGKSTLAKLMAGYLSTSKGTIFYGEKDILDYNLWSLREGITYVSQHEFLFTDTIYNNIDINHTRDREEVIELCKKVLVDEITSEKTSGYQFLLEENAHNLSGGERQRIILARTFLKESNIYILDESFSEIDVKREREILQNLFEQYRDKTIIVISHRLDNNDLYDQVIHFER